MRDAIAAGIYNDLGSGSNIDICVISKNKLDFIRPYDVANRKGERLVFLKLCIVQGCSQQFLFPIMLNLGSQQTLYECAELQLMKKMKLVAAVGR